MRLYDLWRRIEHYYILYYRHVRQYKSHPSTFVLCYHTFPIYCISYFISISLAHNALRGEMTAFRQALQAAKARGPLKQWEVTALQVAADAHLEHIHAHHQNEDHLFGPEFEKRFQFQTKVEEDHKIQLAKIVKLEKLVKELKEGGTVDSILTTWIDYEDYMLPHLIMEEEQGLPLMRAYFTPKEIAPIIAEIIKNSPKHELGALVHWSTPEFFRNEYMPQEGIPSFVWYVDFQWKYSAYLEVFVKNVEAVKSGIEPAAPLSLWQRFLALFS